MDKIFEITIDENSVGDRIDKFLSLSIPSLSRTNIQNLIKTGNVLVNGKEVKEYFYTLDEMNRYQTFNTSSVLEVFDWAERCYSGAYPERDYCDTKNGVIVIPKGYYFVLGDNRGGSKDSRDIGLVKEEDIIGKTKYIVNNLFNPQKIE